MEFTKGGGHEVAAGEGWRVGVWDVKHEDVAALGGCQQSLLPGHIPKSQATFSNLQ